MGFRYVASGPLVRSSYRAGEFFVEAMIKRDRCSAAGSAADSRAAAASGGAGAGAVEVAGVQLAVPELD